jgi:hypothetical protein
MMKRKRESVKKWIWMENLYEWLRHFFFTTVDTPELGHFRIPQSGTLRFDNAFFVFGARILEFFVK